MNDDPSQFDEDHEFEDFTDLENSLKSLQPSPLKIDFVAELERDQRNISASKKSESGKVIVARFIPLAVAACLLISGYLALHLGLFDEDAALPNVAQNEVPAEDADLVNGLPPSSPADHFVPVSAQGFVVKTSLGNVVEDEETGEMAQEENWEILDAYHFHDPETGTNFRQYIPREVKVLNPLDIR